MGVFSVLCSHINQKTQFENPVVEAKKKLSQETAASQQAAAAPSQGNHNAADHKIKKLKTVQRVLTAEELDSHTQ